MYLKSLLSSFNLKITIPHFEIKYTMCCGNIYSSPFNIPAPTPLFRQTALTEN